MPWKWFASSPDWEDVVFWALDLETSGLDTRRDVIVSAAALPIRKGVIHYGERFETLVRQDDPSRGPGEGVGAHHILPAELERAPDLRHLVEALDQRLRGDALLLHFASFDLAFLKRAFRQVGVRWPRPPVVDTVHLLLALHHHLQHIHAHAPPIPTALPEARAFLGLPAYPNHDALADALATAELFLAVRARLRARRLKDLT